MKTFLTVSQAAQRFPFSEAAIRNYIAHEDKNGFSSVIKRVGRKILIDSDAFLIWIGSQGNGKKK